MLNLVIVGATGLVGKSFIKYLETSSMKFNLYFIASENSSGLTINFKNNFYKIITLEMIPNKINCKETIFVNCSSKMIASIIEKKYDKSYLIDNSSQFRMNDKYPLIVPHINMESFINQRVISNPNCSTIILACLLHPLREFGFKRLIVSTYQAVSGAGKSGIDELYNQQNSKILKNNVFKYICANNCFIHDSPKLNNGYSEEEMKMFNETNKIFDKDIPLSCTCVRVPVVRSHCLSVNIEFKNEINPIKMIKNLEKDNNLILLPFDNEPTSIISSNQEKVYVGHIRKDLSNDNAYNFFISGDQILRGASYNAFLILENLYELFCGSHIKKLI